MRAELEEQRKQAPDLPGVYTFKDKAGKPLYIGKAKSLKKRLASHMQNPSTAGGETLLTLSVEIDYVVCDTEWQALLLEQSMIAREQPRFNVRLRTGHNYPYIAVSVDEEYPRVYLTREKRVKSRRYFGPYETKYARQLLDILGRVFQYRTCDGSKPGRRSGSPCLDFFIKRCSAPCADYISKEDYRENIDRLMRFLNGHWQEALDVLEGEMKTSAKAHEFEQAAAYRDKMTALKDLVQKGRISGLSPSQNFDAIGVACFEDKAQVQLLVVREGSLQERRSYQISNAGLASKGDIVRDFLLRFYDSSTIPPLIAVPEGTTETKTIEEFLFESRKGKVEVRVAQKGQAKDLVLLAERNAKINLQKQIIKPDQTNQDFEQTMHSALVDLAGYLDTKREIKRIECYDISNLGPTHTVSAMVVFDDGAMANQDYRRFQIQNQGQNDFAAMEETLQRRVRRYQLNQGLTDQHKERDPSFARLPDLVVIDGGKGQLSAAMKSLEPFIELGVEVISLAKREEEVFVPGKEAPILIEKSEPASLLLQQIRNETHRFAITYHRTKRSKAALVSELDKIPGLGPKRRADLIREFGSAKAVKKASEQELAKVVPLKLAQEIFKTFH